MRYENLVIISQCYELLELKEFLDIALVSSSYDKTTAVYLGAEVIAQLQTAEDTNLAYSLNMLAEFAVPIYAQTAAKIADLSVSAADLAALKADSHNIFPF